MIDTADRRTMTGAYFAILAFSTHFGDEIMKYLKIRKKTPGMQGRIADTEIAILTNNRDSYYVKRITNE